MKRRVRFAVAAVTWAGLAGCGSGGPKMAPVSGIVTLNGKPIEGASIVFTPDPSHKEGQVATDTTGPAGNYKAMTGGRSGVVPGKYKVSVIKARVNPATLSEDFEDDPYMASLAKGPQDPSTRAGKKLAAEEEIRGEFDRDVPPEGGDQDFDVKASSKAK